jgi:hypothetical protein
MLNFYRRLVKNMHMSDLRAAGSGGRGLDIAIEEDNEATFRDDLRLASGIGRPKSKRKVCYSEMFPPYLPY